MAVKLQEAHEHYKQAEKYLKTTLLRWKPDFDSAADEFSQAAQCYRIGRNLKKSKECYLKASDNYKKTNALFHAAKALDNAVRVSKDKSSPDELFHLASEAASLFQQHGSIDSAAVVLERAGKILERKAPQVAIQLYMQAADVTAGDSNQQSGEYLGKCSRLLVRVKRYDDAADCIMREMDFYQEAENMGALGRLTVAIVLVQLARGDIVAATKAYREWGSNCESTEVQTIEQLLKAFDEEDAQSASQALNSPFVRAMDVEYSRLAEMIAPPRAIAPAAKSGARLNAAASCFQPEVGTSVAVTEQIGGTPYEVVTYQKPKEVMKETHLDEIFEEMELC